MEFYGDQQHPEWAKETGLEESMRRLNLWNGEVYPEIPGLPDCAYYVRTGSCGYGTKCRYNHPRDRSMSLGGREYPERVGEPSCQYYLRTGTCKFGGSCKFNHPKNYGGSLTNAPINIYGYPLRPREIQCSYYWKTGQCKFGITCKFDHPQPDGMSVSASALPFYPTVQSLSSPPEQNDSSTPSYRVPRLSLLPGSYVAGAYGPMILPGLVPMPNWNPYSAPISPAPSPGAQPSPGATSVYGLPHLASSTQTYAGSYPQLASSAAGPSGGITKEQKFPEIPGQPDCKYYMRTGDCKYVSSCRYNHPPDWAMSKPSCALSPLGLPLRPGEQACSFYLQKGYCKFGRTCKFDHTTSTVNYNPASSYSEMPG